MNNSQESTTRPLSDPGEIINWPMLRLIYRTDNKKLAKLLPPGIDPSNEAIVTITIYNFFININPNRV